MSVWGAARALLGKDLRAFFRDRTGMLLGFLLPIALIAVFGFIMQVAFGGGSAMPKVTLWVADGDGSSASARLVAQLRAVEMLAIRPRPGEPALPLADARQKVGDGEAHHVLLVPAGYGAALAAGREPALELVRDPGRVMEARIVGIGIGQAFLAASEGALWPAMLGRVLRQQGMDEDHATRLVGAAEGLQGVLRSWFGNAEPAAGSGAGGQDGGVAMDAMLTGLVPMTTTDVQPPARPRNVTYQTAQSIAGMTVMMLMFGLMACATTLLQEREKGTLRRLLAAAMPRESVLLGKFLFGLLVGLLQLAVLFTFGELLFSVGTFRDPVTLLVLSLSWAACATSFGLLIAAWARTGKQAEGLSTLLILVMAALGGCWFPVQMAELPWYAEAITRSTLTWWAMSGYQGMFWQQWSWTHPAMLQALAVQWGFAVVAFGLARWLFHRRYLAG